MISRVLLTILVFVVAACNPPTKIVLYPDAGNTGTVETVFISSTRMPDENGFPGKGRSEVSRYYRYDISVPPDRVAGEISVPGGRINPKKDFLATSAVGLAGKDQFTLSIAKELRKKTNPNKQAMIYVHSYNNSFDTGILRLAQLTHDYGILGVPIAYSWPSAGELLAYEYDRDSNLFARDGLEDLINTVSSSGAKSIHLVAHSMGTQLVMETLRQMAIAKPGSVDRKIKSVILISPDIDVSVFKNQAQNIGKLPDPFLIFVSHDDRLLALSSLVSRESDRVGNIRDVSRLGGLEVSVIDVSAFSKGLGHDAPGDSPELIRILKDIGPIAAAFESEGSGGVGLADMAILTVRSATETILEPGQNTGQ